MIKPFDYVRVLESFESEVLDAVKEVLHSGVLILGPQTQAFEREYATWTGAPHCIGVASGTTAIHLALWALGVGPGDEVIVVANTCTPTIAAIRLCGALPRFIDVDPDSLMMTPEGAAAAIGPRTKAIIAVHLWGNMVDLDPILALGRAHGIPVVEDCAQATGASLDGRNAGTLGTIGCYSFYPTKNLGAYGDAGAVVCADAALADHMRRMRMYGYDATATAQEEGMNARIHEMQAAILRVKLRRLDAWLARRQQIAAHYDARIANPALQILPRHPRGVHAFHQYVVRTSHRAALAAWLKQNDIGFGIHYAVPVHRMPAYAHLLPTCAPLPNTERGCNEVLSLPLQEALSDAEVAQVVDVVNRFMP